MGLWKWLALTSTLGFTLIGGMSLFMPPPPNPQTSRARAIDGRLQVPAETLRLLKRSCYDCHSYETRWPAYSHLWPASALMYSDVSGARKVMNFSEWPSAADDPHEARRAAGLLMASCAAMQSGLMPRHQYLLMHPDAKVSSAEAQQFCAWSTAAVAGIRQKQ